MSCNPASSYFKPRGIPLPETEEICLSLDEIESVRLADLEGLYKEDAALKMNISRQTFGNILNSAHKKIADCIVNGKALKIEGGVIKMNNRYFTCYDCKHEWSLPHGVGIPKDCPKCKSSNIHRTPEDRGWARGGQGTGRGKGRCRRRGVR